MHSLHVVLTLKTHFFSRVVVVVLNGVVLVLEFAVEEVAHIMVHGSDLAFLHEHHETIPKN